MQLPPVNLANAKSYTLPSDSTLARVLSNFDNLAGSGLVVRFDGNSGAAIVNQQTTGAAGVTWAVAELGIPLKAGRVIYNAGDQITLIFS